MRTLHNTVCVACGRQCRWALPSPTATAAAVLNDIATTTTAAIAETRFRPVGRRGKALTARDDELNWTVEPLGRKSHERRTRCHRALRPERPADIGADDAYVCRVHPEGLGDAP